MRRLPTINIAKPIQAVGRGVELTLIVESEDGGEAQFKFMRHSEHRFLLLSRQPKPVIITPVMALPDFNAQGLLPEGVHPATVGDLKDRFVTPFPASVRRQKVFDNFCRYQATVAALGVQPLVMQSK